MMLAVGVSSVMLFAPPLLFEPPFVFPGERFALRWEEPVANDRIALRLAGFENVEVWQEGGRIYGVAKSPAPARFWVWVTRDGSLEDVRVVRVPVALCPLPSAPLVDSPQGPWWIKQGNRYVALVPLGDGYGLWVFSGSREWRIAPVTVLSLGARYAPVRERGIRKDYLYIGTRHITLLGNVGDVARLVLVIEPTGVSATLTAKYDLRGGWWLLGKRYDVRLASGETMRAEAPLP